MYRYLSKLSTFFLLVIQAEKYINITKNLACNRSKWIHFGGMGGWVGEFLLKEKNLCKSESQNHLPEVGLGSRTCCAHTPFWVREFGKKSQKTANSQNPATFSQKTATFSQKTANGLKEYVL
jgi:hypothetical protein